MFYEVYLKLCNSIGKSPSAVANDIGINRATVTFWKNGKSVPNESTMMKIADYFKVDYRALKEGRIVPIYAPIEEKPMMVQEEIEVYNATSQNQESIKRSAEFAAKYVMLTDSQRKLVSELIDTLLEKRK